MNWQSIKSVYYKALIQQDIQQQMSMYWIKSCTFMLGYHYREECSKYYIKYNLLPLW